MNAGRRIIASSGVLLPLALATGAIVAAQPAHPRDRQRIVERWLVEDLAEEDGGRLVRMTRRSGPYRLEYRADFWHGNDGVIQRVSAVGGSCGNDEALDRHLVLPAVEIRTRLTAALADCAAPPRAVRAALRGLEPAYALALAWSREAAASEAAEPPSVYDPEEPTTHARCNTGGRAERDITEMNTLKAAQAAAC